MRTRIGCTALVAAGALLSCAHTTPDAMSAADHDREGMEHRKAAAEEASHYDPHASAVAFSNAPGAESRALIVYNPTDRALDFADTQRRHAEAHARAARALRADEAKACGETPAELRDACPLVTPWVARVVETDHGVELELKPGAPAQALAARMQCHLEHQRVEGFPEEGEALCPLFRKDTTLTLRGNTLEVAAPNDHTAGLIRADARRLFGAPAATAGDQR